MLVVTFYSFKGGVGRTTLATNIAMRLAEQEQRVLLVDFDLEAPGLTYLEELRPPEAGARPRGVAGFLADSWHAKASADYRQYLYDLDGFPGRLAIMPAGAVDSGRFADDLDAVHRGQILNLSESGPTAAASLTLLADLREQWVGDFDYILIDSRTGFSDIGGVCTRVLPDLVVTVLSLNSQGVEGTAQVLSQVGDESILGHPIQKLTAVSMVPVELGEQSVKMLGTIANTLRIPDRDFLIIPFYLPLLVQTQPFLGRRPSQYSLGSSAFVIQNPVMLSYNQVLDGIRFKNERDIEFRLERADERFSRGNDTEPLRQLLRYITRASDAHSWPTAAHVLTRAATLLLSSVGPGGELSPDWDLVTRSLRLALSLFPNAAREALLDEYTRAARSLARALASKSLSAQDVEASLLEASQLYRQIGDGTAEADILMRLGFLAELRGRLDEAESRYRDSLAIRMRVGDQPGEVTSLELLGTTAQARGRLDDANWLLRRALAISEQLGDIHSQADLLRDLGNLAYSQGQLDEAETRYRKSLSYTQQLENEYAGAGLLYQLGRITWERGDLVEALRLMEQAAAIFQDKNDLHNLGIVEQSMALVKEKLKANEQHGESSSLTDTGA